MGEKKLYAFWKYDQFPYVLGGEVSNMDASGAVEIVGYGNGSWFNPFRVVPLASGHKIQAELCKLAFEYHHAEKALRQEFLVKRNKVIEVPGKSNG